MKLEKELEAILNNRQEKPRKYIGASSIGNPCLRAVWYDYRHPEFKEVPYKLKLTFLLGHVIEQMLLDILDIRLPIARQIALESHEVPEFKGHVDAKLLKENQFIEIKSLKNSAFNSLKLHGNDKYFYQVQAYMGMGDVEQTILLAYNKDTSEVFEAVIPFEASVYKELVERARTVRDAEEPLPRISNNPSFYICKMCLYRKNCHGY